MFPIISPSSQVPRIIPRLRHRGPRDARQQTQEHVRHQRGGAQNRGAGDQQQRKVRQKKRTQQLFFRENLNIHIFFYFRYACAAVNTVGAALARSLLEVFDQKDLKVIIENNVIRTFRN